VKIRNKRLLLLLAIAIVPLLVGSIVHRLSIESLGEHLAADARDALTQQAHRLLQNLVDDYGRILRRDKDAIEMALRFQAREVELRLAADPPAEARLYFSEDYDRREDLPPGTALSTKHFRPGANGRPAPIPVSYDEQVYFIVKGVERAAVADDLARLSTMPEVYRFASRSNADLMTWQYTSLEGGFHTSFPGHGGYPAEYDPRTREWYRRAKSEDDLTWIVMPDVSTRTVGMSVAMPVRRPGGAFAGVTAIDVPFTSIFQELHLPQQWRVGSEAMLVVRQPADEGEGAALRIFVHRGYEEQGRDWQTPVEMRFLASEDKTEFDALAADVAAGKVGVRKMRHQGRDALWAYGAAPPGEPFPVVIVPYGLIVGVADQAERYAHGQVVRGLQIAGAVMLLVAVVVATVALVSARSVTRPVHQLADAAQRLSEGDYKTHVAIHTGDELEALGETFNRVGPQLEERQKMKHSLELAKGIQQHLLPQEPPDLEGFDIAGRSIYCDETGGDYFDFIELIELSPHKLGVAVGDVTDHGIAAALLMASARAVLRSNAGRHGADLAALFGALNVHLVRDTGDERFMTLFYGVLDGQERSFWWISGGHDPALWLRKGSDEVEELAGSGFPLGIVEEAEYDPAGPVTLERGDIVLIGTDGAWETRNNQDEFFGKERLCDLVREHADASAADIFQAVVDATVEWRGDRAQDDDLTLVIIKAL